MLGTPNQNVCQTLTANQTKAPPKCVVMIMPVLFDSWDSWCKSPTEVPRTHRYRVLAGH